MQLDLYTPKADQALKQAPEMRVAVLAEWLKQLSDLLPEEAAQKLLAELGRLNRATVDPDLRIQLSQLHEPVVLGLIEAIVSALPEKGIPQAPLARQAANLAYEMAVELSYAWKMCYQGLGQRRALFGGAKTRQNVLAHLLSALSGQICASYRVYTSPPVHSWQELHQVYEAIRKEANAEQGSAKTQQPHETVYKRALLLALADPFRFTRHEIELTLAYLDKFSQLSRFDRGSTNKHSFFLVDTSADAPFHQDADNNQTDMLALDTHDVCKHLRSLIVKLKTGEAFKDIGLPEVSQRVNGLHLLSRLHQSWRGTAKRVFTRYEPNKTFVEAMAGLPAIHRLLNQKPKAGSPGSEASPAGTTRAKADAAQPERWRVVNDSASGLAISAHAQEVAQILMGNPIALREENAEGNTWTLAVIRWGKMSKGQVVVAGVEKLAPNAQSVVLRFADGDEANIGQPALLIPANPALQTEERLLLPRGLFRRSRAADMWLNGEKRRIGLRSLEEETAFFDIVEVDPA